MLGERSYTNPNSYPRDAKDDNYQEPNYVSFELFYGELSPEAVEMILEVLEEYDREEHEKN